MQERETQVGVLDKVMAILQVFSREETLLTPRLPAIYRLAQILSAHGLLEQQEQHFRLLPGQAFTAL